MNRLDPEVFADMLYEGINQQHLTSTEKHPVSIIQVEEPYEYEIDPNPDPEDMPF